MNNRLSRIPEKTDEERGIRDLKAEVYDLSKELRRIEKRLQELNQIIQRAETQKAP